MISNSIKSNDYCVISYLSNMRFSEETYERMKSIIHPKLRKNIDNFKIDGCYVFPHYHNCGKRNRNGTNKKINYRIGEICKSPTYKLNWKSMYDIKWANIKHKIYLTRYGTNYGMNNFAKCKGGQWFDWDKKQYFNRKHWIEAENLYYDNKSPKSN